MPLVQEYAERKLAREALDFGDQLALAARLARGFPDIGRTERTRSATVLLDEFQDTSHAQLVMLRELFGRGHSVTAVGDPNQSIYGWRGASSGTLRTVPDRVRAADGAPPEQRSLSTSWRNDQAMLDRGERDRRAVAGPRPRLRQPGWPGRDAGPGRVAAGSW